MDFLPAGWLVKVDDLRASMVMGQPFQDVWLPKTISIPRRRGAVPEFRRPEPELNIARSLDTRRSRVHFGTGFTF